jgi:hypothetical protein
MNKRFVAAASVLGFSAMNMVAGISPASADPCASWALHGPVTVHHNDGFRIEITNWNGASADSTPDAATLYLPNGQPAQIDSKGYPVAHGSSTNYTSNQTGTVSGGTQGNNLNFTIVWNGLNPKVATTSTYTGTIDANGQASGSDTNNQNHVKGETWNIVQPFQCGS